MFRYYSDYCINPLMNANNNNNYEYYENNYSNHNFQNNYYRSNTNRDRDDVNHNYYENYNRNGFQTHGLAFNYQQSVNYSYVDSSGDHFNGDITDLDDKSFQTIYCPQNSSLIYYNQSQHEVYNHFRDSDNNYRFDFHQRRDFGQHENGITIPNATNFTDFGRIQYNSMNTFNNFAMHSNGLTSGYDYDTKSPQFAHNRQNLSYHSREDIPHTYTPFMPSLTSSPISLLNPSQNPSAIYMKHFSSDPIIDDKYWGPQKVKSPELTQSQSSLPSIVTKISDCTLSSSQSSSQLSTQNSFQTSITSSSNSERNKFKSLKIKKMNKSVRLEIKRKKNRMAAAKCRKKKLELIAVYEKRKSSLINENLDLENEVKVLRTQVMETKQMLLIHKIEDNCKLSPKST